MGFVKCPQEQAVYKRIRGSETLIIGVYVDDIFVTGTSSKEIKAFKMQMMKEFEMSDLGFLSYYLGMEVEQSEHGIKLKQSSYARKILQQTGMEECNPTSYPMQAKLKLDKDEEGDPVDPTEYRRMVGSLRYLTHTRPDLAYSVGVVSRFMERPTSLHLQAVKQILRYVKGTIDFGLMYSKGAAEDVLAGYSDSNLAGDIIDRKSTSGLVFYFLGNIVAWASQKQKSVALSSCEAEFMAATAAACQGIWLRGLLTELTGEEPEPIMLYVDNKSAIELMKNPVFHGRSKHIDTRFHFIRECIEKGLIIVKHVRTEDQRADILTKALPRVKFREMRELLGVKDLE
ncbi:unnamed protein product [Urochloa decumbens]|uniref:Reverse transcriptase Ty1/copia-type domain-containing protein n=1 Tax=Urochloa decumbens TaxID=240449 RepID=A0ABC9CMQ9_9POAL